MSQAIVTKYIPSTNTKGSRIKATCERGTLSIGYHSTDSKENVHVAAAKALCAKFVKEDVANGYGTAEQNRWARPFVSGGINKAGDMAHVFID